MEKTDVPRCYFSRLDTEDVNLQLHYFRDASEAGYGTTSYLRIDYVDRWHDWMCLCDREVTQRTHKDWCVLRLELQGALLVARMDSTVRSDLEFKSLKRSSFGQTRWSCSITSGMFTNLRGQPSDRYQRVHKPRAVETSCWRSQSGRQYNASRGLEMSDLLNNDRWLKGSLFLDDGRKASSTLLPRTFLSWRRRFTPAALGLLQQSKTSSTNPQTGCTRYVHCVEWPGYSSSSIS